MTTDRFRWRVRSSRKKETRLSLSVNRKGLRKTPQRKIAETKAKGQRTNEKIRYLESIILADRRFTLRGTPYVTRIGYQ